MASNTLTTFSCDVCGATQTAHPSIHAPPGWWNLHLRDEPTDGEWKSGGWYITNFQICPACVPEHPGHDYSCSPPPVGVRRLHRAMHRALVVALREAVVQEPVEKDWLAKTAGTR